MRSHKNISRKSFEPLGTNYSGKEVVTNYFRYISFGFWLADSHSVAWLLHNPVMSFLLPMFRIAGDEPPVASFPFTCPLHTCNRIGLVYMSHHSRACNTDVWRYTVQWNCAAKSNNTGGLARSIFFLSFNDYHNFLLSNFYETKQQWHLSYDCDKHWLNNKLMIITKA